MLNFKIIEKRELRQLLKSGHEDAAGHALNNGAGKKELKLMIKCVKSPALVAQAARSLLAIETLAVKDIVFILDNTLDSEIFTQARRRLPENFKPA